MITPDNFGIEKKWLAVMGAQIRMKHMGSTAADLVIEYTIDEATHSIELKADAFDSKLFEAFFVSVLEKRHCLDVVRDDRTEWTPPRPQYRLFLTMHGQRYEVMAHRLVLVVDEGMAIVLEPL